MVIADPACPAALLDRTCLRITQPCRARLLPLHTKVYAAEADKGLGFAGTSVTLFGTLVPPVSGSNDASYSVILDGTATTNFLSSISQQPTVNNAVTDVLVAFSNLADGVHTLRVTMHNPSDTDTVGNSTAGPILAFDRAIVETDAGRPG